MNDISDARQILEKANRVIILAGAGMSQDIGAGTYWTGENRQYAGNMSPYGFTDHEHAQAAMWNTNRDAQIAYYNSTLHGLISTEVNAPHSPYRVLQNYLEHAGKDYFIMTSNVDSAFMRAGYLPDRIFEMHGSRVNSQCLDFPQEHGVFPTDTTAGSFTRCPNCKGDTRPNCLFFVDFAFNPKIKGRQQDAYAAYKATIPNSQAIVLEIGAGTTIAGIRNESLRLNSRHNFPVIRINPHDINENGGLKNILKKSKTAPFIGIENTAIEGLTLLTNG